MKAAISPEAREATAAQVLSDPQRLTAVRQADVLDTPAEEAFDALSRLARSLVGAPVSFLAAVDEKRDFYMSQSGFPDELASARQMTGRTFCHYTVAGAEPLVIEDTHEHPLWRAVPTVASLGVRAYIGVPVMIDSQPIGSFCVIDSCPRAWKPAEVEVIVQLARSAEREIALRGTLRKVQAEADRVNALVRANEELMAVVAHDLRSPLQVMELSAALIARTIDSASEKYVTRLQRAVVSMKGLVDDLVVSHVAGQHKRARRSLIPTAKVLTDAVDTMRVVAERAGIRLSAQPAEAGMVSVDYQQVLRILCNLIGNGIKYCPAGSSVQLAATKDDEGIRITVTDNGPGMSAENQARAFERGWQGSDGMARDDGAGLGLAIVRDLVEENGGTVSLESTPGHGTCITIRLPGFLLSSRPGC